MSAPETKLPPSWDGSVVLDIGGSIGALIIWATEAEHQLEIELEPADASHKAVHSEVRARTTSGGTLYAAVYPQLHEGDYTLEYSGQPVTVRGGEIAEIVFDAAR